MAGYTYQHHRDLRGHLQSLKPAAETTGLNATSNMATSWDGGMRICCSTAERDHCLDRVLHHHQQPVSRQSERVHIIANERKKKEQKKKSKQNKTKKAQNHAPAWSCSVVLLFVTSSPIIRAFSCAKKASCSLALLSKSRNDQIPTVLTIVNANKK